MTSINLTLSRHHVWRVCYSTVYRESWQLILPRFRCCMPDSTHRILQSCNSSSAGFKNQTTTFLERDGKAVVLCSACVSAGASCVQRVCVVLAQVMPDVSDPWQTLLGENYIRVTSELGMIRQELREFRAAVSQCRCVAFQTLVSDVSWCRFDGGSVFLCKFEGLFCRICLHSFTSLALFEPF